MSLFTKTEYGTAGVQFFGSIPAVCGDKIRWLEQVKFSWKNYPFMGTRNYRKAVYAKLKELNDKYPEYNGYVDIY